MHVFSGIGLRTRCLLLVLFAVIPAFALIGYSAVHQRQQAAAGAEREALGLVRLAAREESRYIAATRQFLLGLSKLPEVKRPTSVEACRQVLAAVHRPFSFYRLIGVARADGTVYCRSLPIYTKVNISDRGYFQRAMETRDFGIGDYQIGRATLQAGINFGQAVVDDSGNVQTVVYASLDLDWLNHLIASSDLPPESSVTVLDHLGTVLARFPDPQKFVGRSLRDSPLIRTILDRQTEGTGETVGLDGVARLYAFAPLHEGASGNAYVSVGLSKAVVFAAANAEFMHNLVFLAMVAALAVAVAWVGGDFFLVRRLKALATAARRLGRGDLTARTGLPHGSEELGQLARSFDNMATGLRLMTTALQRVNRALKSLSEVNRAIARAKDEQSLLVDICGAFVGVGRYRFAWIGYAEHDQKKSVRPVAQAGFEGGLDALSDIVQGITWADTEMGRSPIATAIRTLKPCVIRDILAEPDETAWFEQATRRGYASGAAFPLCIQGRALGALAIYSEELDAFSAEEVELLAEATHDLAFGIAALQERVAHDHTLEQIAYSDALTGLPNRAYLELRLRQWLVEPSRATVSLALMIIDLNRLWEINDALGFQHGDQVLREVGARIRAASRPEALVARMRGDEFALLVSVRSGDEAARTARDVLDAFKEAFNVRDLKVHVSAGIGVALSSQVDADASALIRNADVAMHQAKKSGNGYEFYTAEHDQENAERLALIGELRRAIDQSELVLHYQPKIDMRDNSVCGVEALARWNHPVRGMIRPDVFISLAEHTGLIKPLTDWVVAEALHQCAEWRKSGLTVPIAVNLSARNLHDAELVDKINRSLVTNGADPSWLELEITEGAVMQDPEAAQLTLQRLSDMGIKLFIDDFGTGHSSLGYLKRLPVDAVKIDKSFVIDMLTDTESAAIVRSTVELAHDLNMRVVAEGVENQETMDRLALLDCDVAQGYHIAKPLPAAYFVGFCANRLAQRRMAG